MQNKSLEAYMQMPYRTFVMADRCGHKPCFMAYHPELEGCMAQGDTWEEAVENLKSAKYDYLALHLELGWEIPVPEYQIEFPQHASYNIEDNKPRFAVGFNCQANNLMVMA